MKKLKMSLDDLHVESFATLRDDTSVHGTVLGNIRDVPGPGTRPFSDHRNSCYSACFHVCQSVESCAVSCPGGVGHTCMSCDRKCFAEPRTADCHELGEVTDVGC